ncbi:MAG: transcriptional regulator FeaR [Emcibacter sp.]|nr:transcriptional regulator FeaR [Emcibacter sp.]
MEIINSVEMIAPKDRADFWRQSLKNICGGFETISHDWSKFRGNIDVRNIGGFDVAGISLNAHKIIRSQKHVAKEDNQNYFLIMQMQGEAHLSQRNNEAFLKPGDMAFIDSGYPCEFAYDGFMRQISLHIPRKRLENCIPYGSIEAAQTISGAVGMGAVIKNFLSSSYHEASFIARCDDDAVEDALMNLLSATLRGYAAERMQILPSKQLLQIQDVIEQNLTELDLSPSMIAKLCGLSTRHLHRLFQADGISFGEWVRKRRLWEARRQLANKKFSDHSIIDIAFHWGFNDAAHFSRSFRQEFGLSPRQYRMVI